MAPGKPKAEVERALVFRTSQGESILLVARGACIEADLDVGLSRIDEAGPLCPKSRGPGLHVWEGVPAAYRSADGDCDVDYPPAGWRALTDDEKRAFDGTIGPGDTVLDALWGPSAFSPAHPRNQKSPEAT